MDHAYIEEHALIERYSQGDLDGDEEVRFEEHFTGCSECQEQLVLARSLRRGFRAMAAEAAARQVVVGGIFAWLARRSHGLQAGLAAAVLLVALLPATWLLVGPGKPAGDAGVASPSVLLLSAYRDGPGEQTAVIDLATSAPSVVLALDPGDSRFDSFRVSVDDAAGATVLRREGLQLNALEVVMISIPADFFAPGDYRLRLEGVADSGPAVELGGYPFRVVAGAS